VSLTEQEEGHGTDSKPTSRYDHPFHRDRGGGDGWTDVPDKHLLFRGQWAAFFAFMTVAWRKRTMLAFFFSQRR
jgi:hypothetical protein